MGTRHRVAVFILDQRPSGLKEGPQLGPIERQQAGEDGLDGGEEGARRPWFSRYHAYASLLGLPRAFVGAGPSAGPTALGERPGPRERAGSAGFVTP